MDLTAIVMGVSFALMWSSAFTSAHVIVDYAAPLHALALRFLISGLIGIAIARAMGQTVRLSRNQWRAILIFGICQNAFYLGFNFVAMQWVEASVATIVASTLPLVVALASRFIYGERLPLQANLGLVAGFAGVALIMGLRIDQGASLGGLALCVAGVISLAVATLALRHAAPGGGNAMMIVGLQMLVGAAALALPAFLWETPRYVFSWQLAVAFSYTVLVPGLVATLVWFLLVSRIGAVRSATFHFLNPFFGVAIAAVLLSEPFEIVDVFGVAVIAGGILAVQLARAKPTGT